MNPTFLDSIPRKPDVYTWGENREKFIVHSLLRIPQRNRIEKYIDIKCLTEIWGLVYCCPFV
jgi:hypothetical protein